MKKVVYFLVFAIIIILGIIVFVFVNNYSLDKSPPDRIVVEKPFNNSAQFLLGLAIATFLNAVTKSYP